jgi:hypothetical protein
MAGRFSGDLAVKKTMCLIMRSTYPLLAQGQCVMTARNESHHNFSFRTAPKRE